MNGEVIVPTGLMHLWSCGSEDEPNDRASSLKLPSSKKPKGPVVSVA